MSEKQDLPGNPSLPSPAQVFEEMAAFGKKDAKYQVEDFFRMPEVGSYQISPDGRFISWRKRNEAGKRDIYVSEIDKEEVSLFLEEGEDVIRGYGWLSEEQIIFMQDRGGDENYHIYVKSLSGGEVRDLTPFDGVRALINHSLKDDPDHIIVDMNKDNPTLFEPYLLNTKNGELKKLHDNPPCETPIAQFIFDKDAKLRAFTRVLNGMDEVYYTLRHNGEYSKLVEVPFGETFSIIGFDYASSNPNAAYVSSSINSDTSIIYRYDIVENQALEMLFSNDTYDVGGIALSRHRGYELDAFFYEGEKGEVVPVSETYKRWFDDLSAKLGTENKIRIVDADDEEKLLLVFVTSDREPGVYYLYRTETGECEKLTEIFPHLDRKDMSTMMPISFVSRDGLTIHGYYSRPAHAKEGEATPLVVIVHGGPQGIRDSWGFNSQNQLFTSHGFSVLQVNYRISGGYGKRFFNLGLGQVGRKAMDDVEDGIHYVIEKGWVDPKKVAIYGGSHGGFAVLRGLVKTPDLYACGVDYVGVSNLFTFMETIPPYWEPYRELMYKVWYNPNTDEGKRLMNMVSPLQNSEKITKPLFVVQGANDPRVNINEADQIVESLRSRGIDVPYMVKYDEGHGFAKEKNRLDMQHAMLGFLHRYLG